MSLQLASRGMSFCRRGMQHSLPRPLLCHLWRSSSGKICTRTSSSVVGATTNLMPEEVAETVIEEQVLVAPPLSVSAELCVYESPVDLLSLARRARRNSFVGAGMGVCGFMSVLASSTAETSSTMQLLVCAGAAFFIYKHAVMLPRSIPFIALRHVERIVVLPTTDVTDVTKASGETSMDDQLAATSELQLQILTTNLRLQMTLNEPADMWDGARYSGLVNDTRTTFVTMLQERQALHVDEVSSSGKPGLPTSADPALLQALAASTKVIAQQEVDCRTDVDDVLKLPSDGQKLASEQLADKKSKSSRRRVPPAVEIKQLGISSLISGCVFLMAGSIFIAKSAAQDASSPGKRDPTLGDLMKKLKGRSDPSEAQS
mmetsp:Transcript_98396/g.195095  ORF Transcript_98396/g.195095 Transcript_98396/m.195095 type:complete len:374 (-) Transcript_98396:80-1201(-)